MKLVLDTNVLVSAFRSKQGTSNHLLKVVRQRRIPFAASVALVLEYEDVLLRPGMVPQTPEQIGRFIDAFVRLADRQRIFFTWRPSLTDPGDEFLLELAVAAQATHIITHNTKHFRPAAGFGIKVMTPHSFLDSIDALP